MRHSFSDLKAFRHEPLQFLLDRGSESEPGLIPLHLGRRPYYLVTDPDLARAILKMDPDVVDKGRIVQKLRPFIGDSFLISGSKEHGERREVLHHQLARGVAQQYVPEMAAVVRQLAANLASTQTFDAHEVTAPLALNMICVALFGHQSLSSGDRQALISALNLIEDEIADEMFRVTPLTPWTYFARRRRRKAARATMTFVVNKVRRNAAASSVLSALEGLELNETQITDEILTALVAGHHTTGTSAAWALYYLAKDPALADAIAEEAAAVSSDTGDIRPESLKNATTSLALAREVLRLYPAAWWFARETKRSIELAGRTIERGAALIVSPWQIHRDPRYWSDPERFDITRSHAGSAYLPFGAGPRVCVGMGVALLEMQLLALELCSAFEFRSVSPEAPSWPRPSVTLIPPAIEIGIRPRLNTVTQVRAA